ncbi:hypothetical protein [Pseudomonas indica]|uniref:hypothetical protein n=1 Tax=Pseudomonas indica TaxID=137658 RepID=UPI003FCF2F96
MILYYSANGISGQLSLPSSFVEDCRAEDLAELVASDFWRHRPTETPSLMTLIHLQDVDGADLGIFEVRRDMRPVFTATLLGQAGKGGAEGVSLPATLPAAPESN